MNEAKGLEGLEYRIKSYPIIKKHLLKSAQLNPNDFCVYYMLGKMTYELCNMSRFQRFIARHLYAEPSQASFREAYEYLQRAEELQPRCFVPNLFYLGSVCIKMKMYYRAQYYLTMAMNLGTNGKTEKRYAYKARQIIDRMEKYDLGKDVLYTSHLHGYGFTDWHVLFCVLLKYIQPMYDWNWNSVGGWEPGAFPASKKKHLASRNL